MKGQVTKGSEKVKEWSPEDQLKKIFTVDAGLQILLVSGDEELWFVALIMGVGVKQRALEMSDLKF